MSNSSSRRPVVAVIVRYRSASFARVPSQRVSTSAPVFILFLARTDRAVDIFRKVCHGTYSYGLCTKESSSTRSCSSRAGPQGSGHVGVTCHDPPPTAGTQ